MKYNDRFGQKCMNQVQTLCHKIDIQDVIPDLSEKIYFWITFFQKNIFGTETFVAITFYWIA